MYQAACFEQDARQRYESQIELNTQQVCLLKYNGDMEHLEGFGISERCSYILTSSTIDITEIIIITLFIEDIMGV